MSKADLALLDAIRRRYSCRPSAIARGNILDLHIDLAATIAGIENEGTVDPEH